MTKGTALAPQYDINIPKEFFNDVYYPHLKSIHRYEVYYGGSSSGKSTFVAQKLALQLTLLENRNLVCLRQQGSDARDSVYPEIQSALSKFSLLDVWHIVESPEPRMTNRINGNVIAFTGLDSAENIKSIKFKEGKNLTDIWYEEVTEEYEMKNLRELNRRLRGGTEKKRMIMSFNPIYSTHPIRNYIEKDLANRDILVVKTTYKDNRFLTKDDIAEIELLRYTSPYEYMVYALGEWGTTGQTVFNANLVQSRLTRLLEIQSKNPPARVEFKYESNSKGLPDIEKITEFNNPDGETTIYIEPNPKRPYVAAFDTAGEGADWYAMHVFDNVSDEQVATFHSVKNPDECMLQIYGLLKKYNNALVAPEINFDSYPVAKLKEWGYLNIYQRSSPKDDYHETTEQKLGFRTTVANRQFILSNLVDWTVQNMGKINDVATLQEMLTFTRQARRNKGIYWGAEEGAHDDMIISLAILLQAKEQQVSYEIAEMKKIEGYWTRSELEVGVLKGRIDNAVARGYILDNKDRFEKPFRRSRYAR